MFHRRSSEFEPRISAITDHLRGIRKELGIIGDSAGQSAAGAAAAAVEQIADTLRPVLQDIEDRLRSGQRRAVAWAARRWTGSVSRPKAIPSRRLRLRSASGS
jgi:hypothetical protein